MNDAVETSLISAACHPKLQVGSHKCSTLFFGTASEDRCRLSTELLRRSCCYGASARPRDDLPLRRLVCSLL